MTTSIPTRRMLENESVFREFNESVKKGFDNLEQIAKEDGQESFIKPSDDRLQFYCECSDENCRLRIPIRPTEYEEIHKNRSQFVLVEGHEVSSIEKVIIKKAEYIVVEKDITPPAYPKKLNQTDVENV